MNPKYLLPLRNFHTNILQYSQSSCLRSGARATGGKRYGETSGVPTVKKKETGFGGVAPRDWEEGIKTK